MKAKQLLILLLTGTLSLTLVGCNEPLEDNTTENPVEPDNGDDGSGDGGDDGSGDGGDDGSGDGGDDGSGDGGEPTENVGTWENKDEDGDGVPDEQDDYPFDANVSTSAYFQESELNDNLAEAENLDTEIPYFVSGVVQQTQDLDLFKFTTNMAERVSVVLNTNSSDFRPNITILDSNGASVEKISSNFTAIGSIGAASNFTLPSAGTYYLGISDVDARGNSDFTYKAKLFFDIDIDYIDDGLEPAFGLVVGDIDSDNDRVFDGTEFYVYEFGNKYLHDVDSDGIPNWLDDDSDADGIPDKIESVSDQDQDGFANFVDLDSDGNGNADASEVTDISSQLPADSDGDGISDYADVDDDNDGLLDLNDTNPTKIVDSTFPGEADYKEISAVSYIFSGQSFNGIFVGNGTHTATGTGLNSPGILVFKRADNLPPINERVSPNQEITFVLPEKTESIYFFANGKRSNLVNVDISNPNLPLVLKPEVDYYSVGNTVNLTGQNFFEDTLVFIDEIEVKPSITNEERLSFVVPDSVSSEAKITVRTTYGTSNTVAIKIGDEVLLDYSQLNMPNDTLASLLVASLKTPTSQEELIGDDLSVDYIFGGVSDVVMALYIDENGEPYEFINTVVFQSDESITVTPNHIASSSVWYSGAFGNNIEQSSWREGFDTISLNEDVKILADFIEANLSNPRFIDDNSAEYQSLLNKAILSSREVVENLIVNNSKISPKYTTQSLQKNINTSSYISSNTITESSVASNEEAEYKPIVTSDWAGSAGDIEVNGVKVWDNFGDRIFNGNVAVDNDTGLFLSAQLRNLGDEYLDQILQPHVINTIDGNMLGPQTWGILNLSVEKDFDHCNYRDCYVEVVTPGIKSPYPTTEAGETARNILIFRTAVDQVIVPFIGYAVDKNNLYQDREWVKNLVVESYPLFLKAVELEQSKNSTELMKKFFEIVYEDLITEGPITSLGAVILQKAGTTQIGKVIIKKVTKILAPLVVPVIGEAVAIANAINEALKGANLANKLANVTLDLIDVPSKVGFEVEWPVVIDTVVPESIIKDELENDVTLILEGKGFFPHTFLGFKTFPEVSVFDTKGTTSTDDDTEVYEAKETTHLHLNSEGSAIDFLLIDKEKVKNAIGPLKVYVEVSDAKPNIDITFSDGLSLTSLKPDTAFSGTEIEINGAGFSTKNIENTVTFLGKTGRIQATVVSSSSNKLVVKVPQDVKTGDVNVKVKSVQAKNALLFTNRESGATVRFGDNGNLKDDIFTLTFNEASKQISLGQRKEEIFTSLTPGDYKVILTANDIPDGRGTYYVCFSDNITVLSGSSPVTAKTVLAKAGDTVSWNIKVGQATGKTISKCSQSAIQANSINKARILNNID